MEGKISLREYEVFVENFKHGNPCGGEAHTQKDLIEVEAESPEAYVKENGVFPILDIIKMANGDTVIMTGDCMGNSVRYTFIE